MTLAYEHSSHHAVKESFMAEIVDEVEDVGVDEPVAEEVLVEEVSIDGMCGVY
jgi:mycofactocin precursor